MQRRDFLRTGALAAAAFGASGLRAVARPRRAVPEDSPIPGRRPGVHLRLSLAAYSFREALNADPPRLDLPTFLDDCARHDLDAAELTSYYFRDTSNATLTALRRRATVNGLTISGVPVRNDFCQSDPEARKRDADHVRTWIRHAATLGAQTMRVFAGQKPDGVSLEEAQARCIDELGKIAEDAARSGVVLALENHGGITATAEQLLTLVKGVGSPWLGVNLDTGNFSKQPYEQMEQAAPYAVACQVKIETRDGDQRAPADYPRIAGILRRAGYRGFVALEYEGREDPFVAVPEHLNALRRALASA